jgi:hypothetical protein
LKGLLETRCLIKKATEYIMPIIGAKKIIRTGIKSQTGWLGRGLKKVAYMIKIQHKKYSARKKVEILCL